MTRDKTTYRVEGLDATLMMANRWLKDQILDLVEVDVARKTLEDMDKVLRHARPDENLVMVPWRVAAPLTVLYHPHDVPPSFV